MANLTVKDFDEFVNPDYVAVTLSNGKTIKISKKRISGGAKAYQAVLYALDNYKTNPIAKTWMDNVVNKIADLLK